MGEKVKGPVRPDLLHRQLADPLGYGLAILEQDDLGAVATDWRIRRQVDLGLEQAPVDKDHAVVLGATVRFQGNRLTEWRGGPTSGLVSGLRSVVAIGNQTTSKLLVAPAPSPRTIDQLNVVVG